MSFVKSQDYIEKLRAFTPIYNDAETFFVFWLTTPEIVERLLPPPLKPAADPVVLSFVATYPSSNYVSGGTGHDAGLTLAAEFDGEIVFYCITNPVSVDNAMSSVREIAIVREGIGWPIKYASIALARDDTSVEGWVERHGIRFFQASAT
jgi:acetoacetate decarboxylase